MEALTCLFSFLVLYINCQQWRKTMCKCGQAVKPGNADIILINDQYTLVHKDCQYQLDLPFFPPEKPDKVPNYWDLPQYEG